MIRLTGLKIVGAAVAAMTVVACSAQPAPPAVAEAPSAPPAPKVLTGAERAAWYQECWTHFNNKSWPALKACYTETAESDQIDSGMPVAKGADAVIKSAQDFAAAFPDIKGTGQMVFVHGDDVVGVYLLNGTHAGPLPGPGGKAIPATNKKIGYSMVHVMQLDSTGAKGTKESMYADGGTLMAQIGLNPAPARPVMEGGPASPTVVVSTGSETETKNVAAFRAGADAFNKHDVKELASYNAPDAVFHDMTQPKDMDAKGNVAMIGQFFKAFPDCRLTIDSSWGAGDYVVSRGVFEGTNKGAAPAMGITKATGKPVRSQFIEITRMDGGKVKEDWLFFDSMAFAGQLGLLAN